MADTEIKRDSRFPRSRVLVMAMVGGAAFISVCLVAFALLSEFPGDTQTNTNKADAPPEDVIRSQNRLLND